MIRLRAGSLAALPARVARPAFRRGALTPGIVHVGVGNFHRAHQAVWLDDLMARGLAREWAIVGGGVRPPDTATRARLAPQDWLYTVVERGPGAGAARIVGAMVGFAPPAPDNAPLIRVMSDPRIRIVSLTVTEGGYFIDPETGAFDLEAPEIRADARAPESPSGVFGAIAAALRARRAAGAAPFTVMSCDNMPGNGRAARAATVGAARLSDPAFAEWIDDSVAFPDSMVDRITPAAADRERALLREEFGIADEAPVFCEPFRQWVLEDRFSAGRPPLEEAGVTFTANVAAWEAMKIRVLNGGHAAIAYLSALLGIDRTHEAMAHPLVRGFLDRLERREILPTVTPPPGSDPPRYYEQVAARFANPEIGDTIARLCRDGSDRQPRFILPTVRDRLARGLPVDLLALEVALWCRCCAGTGEDGKPLRVEDSKADRLARHAREARTRPAAFLEQPDIFGALAGSEAFRAAFARALAALWRDGVAATVARSIAREPDDARSIAREPDDARFIACEAGAT